MLFKGCRQRDTGIIEEIFTGCLIWIHSQFTIGGYTVVRMAGAQAERGRLVRFWR
jgi:hypothetical protein